MIDRYRPVMAKAGGDAARGKDIFQKNCAVCHEQNAQEKNVAPNLAILDDRSADTLLVSILDPNRDVKPVYVSYTLVTKDGQDFTGVVSGETNAAVTVRRLGGLEDTVQRQHPKPQVQRHVPHARRAGGGNRAGADGGFDPVRAGDAVNDGRTTTEEQRPQMNTDEHG